MSLIQAIQKRNAYVELAIAKKKEYKELQSTKANQQKNDLEIIKSKAKLDL